MDDEGTSELTTEIYELDRKKLELGAVIGQVLILAVLVIQKLNVLRFRVIMARYVWE